MIVAARRLPTVRTRRLILRPFRDADAPALVRLLSDEDVSQYLLRVPYPYTRESADAWIAHTAEVWAAGSAAHWGIAKGRTLIGSCGLTLTPRHAHAELGYWLGRDHWGQGYAREAAAAAVAWGFRVLGLRRVYGQYLGDNHASGRVMESIGMLREGVRRQHLKKRGRWYDLHQYGVLREEVSWRTRS